MDIFLALFTYFAYAFIVVAYGSKVIKYVRMPVHLRWELFTSTDASKPFQRDDIVAVSGQQASRSNKWRLSRVWLFLREYLWFPSYFSHNKVYWIFLYIAHIGFVGLIIFQILCITIAAGAVMFYDQVNGSIDNAVESLLVLRIMLGIISFAAGIIGNIGLMFYRINNRDLRLYTPLLTFIGYCVSIGISLIGFILLLTSDPHFSGYVTFFAGMIQFKPTEISGLLAVFIFLNALHLIYLPFTPGFHYITRAFAFFGVQWDMRPNTKGSTMEKAVSQILKKRMTWSAPHIKAGQTWEEAAKDKK
jgi:hypothetical protein